MKFKFQILDLFVFTTCAASLAGAYQADLILFRQLLCLCFVICFSTYAVVCYSNSKRSARIIGGIGGFLGGMVYLLVAYLCAGYFYKAPTFFSPGVFPEWIFDVPPALILSILFGATIGPLFALRFQNRSIPNDFRKPFWFSIILLGGVFLLGLFAMFDRLSMQSRDWLVVALVLSAVFVIHTNDWMTRFQTQKSSQPD